MFFFGSIDVVRVGGFMLRTAACFDGASLTCPAMHAHPHRRASEGGGAVGPCRRRRRAAACFFFGVGPGAQSRSVVRVRRHCLVVCVSLGLGWLGGRGVGQEGLDRRVGAPWWCGECGPSDVVVLLLLGASSIDVYMCTPPWLAVVVVLGRLMDGKASLCLLRTSL